MRYKASYLIGYASRRMTWFADVWSVVSALWTVGSVGGPWALVVVLMLLNGGWKACLVLVKDLGVYLGRIIGRVIRWLVIRVSQFAYDRSLPEWILFASLVAAGVFYTRMDQQREHMDILMDCVAKMRNDSING